MVSLPKDLLIELGWKSGDKILEEQNGRSIVLNKAEEPKVFSVGYEGRESNDFVKLLKENEIGVLVDVRNHAFSWKKEFSMKSLSDRLTASGIRYVNLPKLGAPRDMRVEIKENGNREKFFSEYSAWLNSNISYLDLLDVQARQITTAIMCLEADYRDCHRKIIGEKLHARGYEVIQL